MSRVLTLDTRNMAPPEPLERVRAAIDGFEPGDRLKVLIDFEPLPLYRILDRNGLRHRAERGAEGHYEIAIWMQAPAPA
jgi:TusA-related sulfurtransferase